ncbi:hypothetical protein DEO72_LG10g1605 [Vigna unguiculata]|uniref:Uncharacterized protein n=1 Tax=Vigna unguiculata TaxID=3917 RepID=A0A4D6NDY2_VIGUN|nr:hypothetical protein DEO72_LG10g1605 [Vigna unguiculata]
MAATAAISSPATTNLQQWRRHHLPPSNRDARLHLAETGSHHQHHRDAPLPRFCSTTYNADSHRDAPPPSRPSSPQRILHVSQSFSPPTDPSHTANGNLRTTSGHHGSRSLQPPFHGSFVGADNNEPPTRGTLHNREREVHAPAAAARQSSIDAAAARSKT